MKKYSLGIIGSGSLGSIIARYVYEEMSDDYEVLGFLVRNRDKATDLAKSLDAKVYDNLDDLIGDSPDYIIEAASTSTVKNMGIKILENGINLIPLSVGAFVDEEFYKEIIKTALENNCRIHIPSGAVGGFDVLGAAMLMGNGDVSIVTEKSPDSLKGAPYLDGKDLPEDEELEVFNGTAKYAIEGFPANVNVAVATALVTSGVDKTRVSINSIPGRKGNKHEIKLRGENINIGISIDSIPSPVNPRSSSLAAYSVLLILKNLVSPITF